MKESDPNEAKYFLERGIEKFYASEYEEALNFINSFLRIYSNYSKAYCYLARIYQALEDIESAAEAMDKAVEFDQKNELYLKLRGDLNCHRENYKEAILDYDAALAINSKFVDAFVARAEANFLLIEFDKAFDDLNTALGLDPDNCVIYYKRGLMFLLSGDLGKAFNDFVYSNKLNSRYIEAYLGLACVYREREDFNNAVKCYNKAIILDPKNGFLYFCRGNVNLELGNNEMASLDFLKAKKMGEKAAIKFLH